MIQTFDEWIGPHLTFVVNYDQGAKVIYLFLSGTVFNANHSFESLSIMSDSPDFSASGSRLLSMDSPSFPSDSSHSSRTGPGGDDLSLSELSLGDQTPIMSKPFSLLAKFNLPPQPHPQADLSTPTRGGKSDVDEELIEEDEEHEEEVEEVQDPEVARQRARELRDEKLKSDVFILKKLNASFELFHEALQDTGSANEVSLLITLT